MRARVPGVIIRICRIVLLEIIYRVRASVWGCAPEPVTEVISEDKVVTEIVDVHSARASP